MKEHSAASVADAANRIIAQSESLSAKLIVAETRSSPTPLAETVARALAFLSRDATNRVLMIFDDPPWDIGLEMSDGVLDGSDVMVCADKPPDLEPGDRVTGRIEYGSLLNLPRASSSIEAVVWVPRELESDIAPFALREIFRVLKPGGQLVLAALGESTGLDLDRSLLAARIAFDEDEMPSAPVYSCSLRKNGARGEGVPPHTGQALINAVDPRLALLEEENGRQIALVHDRFAQQEKVMDEARAVVDDARSARVRRRRLDLDFEPVCRGLSDQILHARMAQRLGLGDLEPGEQMPSHVAIRRGAALARPSLGAAASPRPSSNQRVKPDHNRSSRQRRTDREFPSID